MRNDLTFVKATPEDAVETVRLIGLADQEALIEISGKATYVEALAEYEKQFVRTDVYFSYKNIILAKMDDQIVGSILFFKGEEEINYAQSEEHELLDVREAADDEIYIDSLAVNEEYRGQGIAKQLVMQVVKYAPTVGYQKVSLLADLSQPHLGVLYRKLGFKERSRLVLHDVEYEKLIFEYPTIE